MTNEKTTKVLKGMKEESSLYRKVITDIQHTADVLNGELYDRLIMAFEDAYNKPKYVKNHVCWTQNLKFLNKHKREIQKFLRERKIDVSRESFYNSEDPFFMGATNVNGISWLVISLIAAEVLDNLENANAGI